MPEMPTTITVPITVDADYAAATSSNLPVKIEYDWSRASTTAVEQPVPGSLSGRDLAADQGRSIEDARGHRVFIPAEMRAKDARADSDEPGVYGYASRTETPYDHWDAFGLYEETVARGAFKATLAADPEVALLINHGATSSGLPLATTGSRSLRLEEDKEGLFYDGDLDPEDPEAASLMRKVEQGKVTESSFRFDIVRAEWSEDYESLRILEVDLNRGDVAPVAYGANPHTEIHLRYARNTELGWSEAPATPEERAELLRAAGKRRAAALGGRTTRTVTPEDGDDLYIARCKVDLEAIA